MDLAPDPDCAICRLPPSAECGCESAAMIRAVKDAEARIIKSSYRRVREWARKCAQDYILEYFRLLSERRKAAYRTQIQALRDNTARYFGAHGVGQPHPTDVRRARDELKRGINDDWQASVQRYPEVLDYFFSLVKVKYPPPTDPSVKDPPLSAMNGVVRRSRRLSHSV